MQTILLAAVGWTGTEGGGAGAALSATVQAVAQLAVGLAVAYAVVAAGWFKREGIRGVSDAVVQLFLPCMIFANVLAQFDPARLSWWWGLPLAAVVQVAVGLGLAWLLFARDWRSKLPLLAMGGLQNAGYLTLPIGKLVLPPEVFPEFALYTFLYILAYNPMLWSVGKILVTGQGLAAPGQPFPWKQLVTPPVCAIALALALVFTGLRGWIPAPVTGAIGLLGEATIPAATFVLGTSLATVPLGLGGRWADITRVVTAKLLLAPAVTLAALWWTPLGTAVPPVLALMLLLQSTSAPATAIVLQIQTYGGDLKQAGPVLLVSYVVCLVTIPLWLGLWLGR